MFAQCVCCSFVLGVRWGGGGGVRQSDNLELSVWKEACPPIKRIIKPYLTPNYFF